MNSKESLFLIFEKRKWEVMQGMVHPLRGVGHRSVLIGRLVGEQLMAELMADPPTSDPLTASSGDASHVAGTIRPDRPVVP